MFKVYQKVLFIKKLGIEKLSFIVTDKRNFDDILWRFFDLRRNLSRFVLSLFLLNLCGFWTELFGKINKGLILNSQWKDISSLILALINGDQWQKIRFLSHFLELFRFIRSSLVIFPKLRHLLAKQVMRSLLEKTNSRSMIANDG